MFCSFYFGDNSTHLPNVNQYNFGPALYGKMLHAGTSQQETSTVMVYLSSTVCDVMYITDIKVNDGRKSAIF